MIEPDRFPFHTGRNPSGFVIIKPKFSLGRLLLSRILRLEKHNGFTEPLSQLWSLIYLTPLTSR